MTARQVFEYVLIELNKVQAPSLLLEDYNYFINKAVGQYINKRYNAYAINQQMSDDLQVLQSSTILTPITATEFLTSDLLSNTKQVNLPDDYLHILGCVIEYLSTNKCNSTPIPVQYRAKRMTADMWAGITNNYYHKASYKNPYYYINNVNTSNTFSTKDSRVGVFEKLDLHTYAVEWREHVLYNIDDIIKVSDGDDVVAFYKCYISHTSVNEFDPSKFSLLGGSEKNPGTEWTPFYYSLDSINVDRLPGERYGNYSKVRMELRYGKENPSFILSKVYVDYLKVPKFIRLTQEQIDEVEDTSQIFEFPDYVCQEIVNELVKLLMENASDPRLQTNIPINQTIAQPQQVGQRTR